MSLFLSIDILGCLNATHVFLCIKVIGSERKAKILSDHVMLDLVKNLLLKFNNYIFVILDKKMYFVKSYQAFHTLYKRFYLNGLCVL